MQTLVRTFLACALLAGAGCGQLGGGEPPREFLARRLDRDSFLVVGQVASYYDGGGSARWRDLGDGSFAYDINDRDPLTNQPRTINIIFSPIEATRTRPELAAVISDVALDGERLSSAEIQSLMATLRSELSPPLPRYFERAKAGTFAKPEQALTCDMEEAADFGPFTVGDLDRAYQKVRGWRRYERTGGVLSDGAPFGYLVFAANEEVQERVEYAVATTPQGVAIIASQGVDEAGVRGPWRGGLKMCAETAALASLAADAAPVATVEIAGISPGMRYREAREALIRSGFTPFPAPHQARRCELMQEACVAYRELLDCSGTGIGICTTAFARNDDGRMLLVYTAGEFSSDFGGETGVHSMSWADAETVAELRL